ncbi:MAG: hypothetical protein OZ913_01745 [Ignavibacteriaceae bacterium]|jgi:hypothetical protein|nr:MAG: hypothetical protein EDM69_07720 [Chlorobiota bacterium]KXK04633.1 MAG: hypothetical protein UZ04_CHB001001009 [Chlorobi bacterium OLB4]MBV6399503.1 hypothetical protein [Ignavibacteria bacterium]MCC6886653.1 hypothetical protein [Ignavibacteriales bacterium]MCE7953208.1 hypothetical protein [Chlorobi bacterium CHB7]MEB2329009.1 hypothetical protein [Ignavibacteriaceae bacterium]OQY76545.1 MAG: hypothetical protein B6D43_10220 [Ignavibacteriales bacterium UTCHB1]RIK50076.1 MAG: hypot
MKKITLFAVLALAFGIFGFNNDANAQTSPVLYFCESYGSYGEIGISDRFTTGYLTVMVKADDPLGLSDVSIQFDKYNPSTKSFAYYKKFPYNVTPDMNYIYFSGDDLSFDTPGIYRVFLLDDSGNTVTSGLIEIISKY